jgi:hypothetical protein
VELVGKGGMGAVYRAEHRHMGRPVAIKVLKPALLGDADSLARFQREVHAVSRLDHDNIVRAYDADSAGGLHFLVMEFVPGTTLDRLVQERGPLPVRQACEYVSQAARGLQYAHERGLVHRDIKPSNLLVTPEGRVKILDFGLARLLRDADPGESDTGAGTVLGTANYMAPEQGLDPHAADIRADVYSLGCTLYHLLAGQPPFPGGSFARKLREHQTQPLPALSAFRSDVPAGLVAVLRWMTAKDPRQRYQTPGEVALALAPFLQPPAPPRRRWSLVAAAAGAAALVLAGVYLVATDRGTIEIRTDEDDVEVIVKQGGKTVVILDRATDRQVELRSGEYVVELGGKGEGLRLSSEAIKIQRGKKTIVEVRRLPPKPEAAEVRVEPPARPKVVTIAGGLTVARDGSGQYRTIGEALNAVKAGQTVRILDDATYPEALTITDSARHTGLVLEAPRGATLLASAPARQALLIDSVPGVVVRGLRLRVSGLAHRPLVLVKGQSSGVVLEGLDLEADQRMTGIALVNLRIPEDRPPVVVRRCALAGNWDGIIITTAGNPKLERSQRIVLRENRVRGAQRGILLDGPAEQIHIVGNLVWECGLGGIQLQDVWEDSRSILVANNTVTQSGACLRFWQDPGKLILRKDQVHVCGNACVSPEAGDMIAHVGSKTGSGTNSAAFNREIVAKWRFDHNWRDISGNEMADALPLAARDNRLKAVHFASRVPAEADFLRPTTESPLARGGAGGDLPGYAGAVPPEGVEPWDWERTWKARTGKGKK